MVDRSLGLGGCRGEQVPSALPDRCRSFNCHRERSNVLLIALDVLATVKEGKKGGHDEQYHFRNLAPALTVFTVFLHYVAQLVQEFYEAMEVWPASSITHRSW
jgi:hypothetical protein